MYHFFTNHINSLFISNKYNWLEFFKINSDTLVGHLLTSFFSTIKKENYVATYVQPP